MADLPAMSEGGSLQDEGEARDSEPDVGNGHGAVPVSDGFEAVESAVEENAAVGDAGPEDGAVDNTSHIVEGLLNEIISKVCHMWHRETDVSYVLPGLLFLAVI